MGRLKSSKAENFSMRLNPIHPQEASAMEHLEKCKNNGYDFKATVVDALNRAAGKTPEMFAPANSQMAQFAGIVEVMLNSFATELVSKLGTGEVKVFHKPEENSKHPNGITAFTRNFVNGFQQRQSQTVGHVEEDDE